MAQPIYVVIKYQGPFGGYLKIDKDVDGKGYLQLSTTLPTDPSIYCFEKKVVSSERREGRHIDNVMFRSCENMTKYLTGYGHGWGYIVSGEPTILNGGSQPCAFSHWQVHSYQQVTKTGDENRGLVALYNPEGDCYFIIKINASYAPEFRLSNNIEDVKSCGAFVIDSVLQNN